MGAQPVDYEALARQNGAIQSAGKPDYAAIAKQFGASASEPTAPVQSPEGDQPASVSGVAHVMGDQAKRFLGAAAETLNPMNVIHAVIHPADTASAAFGSTVDALDRFDAARKKGDWKDAATSLAGAVPMLGPAAEQVIREIQDGKYSEAMGHAAGLRLSFEAGHVVPKILDAVAPAAAPAAERLYTSALKPSVRAGAAAGRELVQTGLSHGIPVSEAGATKLAGLIDDLNGRIKDTIQSGANKGKTIDPNAVAKRLDQTRAQFASQVNPDADLAAIDASKQEFLRSAGARPGQPAQPPQPTGVLDAQGKPVMTAGTPSTPATPAQPIPADAAQDIKQGTYSQIRKSYGQLSGAQVEAQKALARGIKEELANTFPELGSLNAEDSKLLQLQPTLDKAVARIANHDMLGIGAPVAAGAGAAVAGGPGAAAAAVLKRVLDDPGMKSKIAIAISSGSKGSKTPIALSAAMARVNAYADALQSGDQKPQP